MVRSGVSQVSSRCSRKAQDYGEEEPRLMGWKKVYEAPARVVKEERQRFLQSKAGWYEFQE